jgi:hypothetical protein
MLGYVNVTLAYKVSRRDKYLSKPANKSKLSDSG